MLYSFLNLCFSIFSLIYLNVLILVRLILYMFLIAKFWPKKHGWLESHLIKFSSILWVHALWSPNNCDSEPYLHLLKFMLYFGYLSVHIWSKTDIVVNKTLHFDFLLAHIWSKTDMLVLKNHLLLIRP